MNDLSRAAAAALSMLALAIGPLAHGADEAKPNVAAASGASAAAAPAASTSAAATPAASAGAIETGLAAVYSDRLQGRKTASGERYDRSRLTAAHKTLPFGTRVKVTNTHNRRTVVVRIDDRGPTQAGRILDLSPAAARALGIRAKGMAEVSAEVVGEAPKR
jgi:rare lipoprotein A